MEHDRKRLTTSLIVCNYYVKDVSGQAIVYLVCGKKSTGDTRRGFKAYGTMGVILTEDKVILLFFLLSGAAVR